jgi:transcriptional regulator with XRE-family HTH domain
MIDQFTNLDDDDLFPAGPLNLAVRMRELRVRQGLKQSEVARRMGLDPSIPSLWEQGKRPVPASRVRALAEALGVTTSELLQGVVDESTGNPVRPLPGIARPGLGDLAASVQAYRERAALLERSQMLTLVSAQSQPRPTAPEASSPPPAPIPPPIRWSPQPRPPLTGWIPDGWLVTDRILDISPSLPDGFWLDPVRLERPQARQILRDRLCDADSALVGDRAVPGAALAERYFQHCSEQPTAGAPARLPLIESIFRAVAASDRGGLTVDELVELFANRVGAVPVTRALLSRMRDSILPYPLRWVDRDLFE